MLGSVDEGDPSPLGLFRLQRWSLLELRVKCNSLVHYGWYETDGKKTNGPYTLYWCENAVSFKEPETLQSGSV